MRAMSGASPASQAPGRSVRPTWTRLENPFPLWAFTVATLSVAPLAAQEPASQEPPATVVEEELTVTAQRVEQSLQEVPISIVAFESEDLEQQAISDIQELADAAPGLVVSGQSSSTGEVALYIRGIGSNTFGLGTESTVGYYLDGVYIPRPQGFLNQFLDVERVEVLRGPQGTLWGRNSTGGAINVVTKSPEGSFAGRLFGELAQYDSPETADEQRLYLSFTGPLSERVYGRFSASQAESDDFTFNQALGRLGQTFDGVAARGAITFLPSDSLSLTVRADHTDDDSHNNFNLKPGPLSPLSTLGTLVRFFDLPNPTDTHRIAANIPPVSEYQETGLALDLDWVLGSSGTELQSITSYRELDSRRVADIDATLLDFVENAGDFDVEWWSQEVKLNGGSDRLDWIAGAYYFHEEGRTLVDTRTDLALFQVFFFASNPALFLFDPSSFCSLGFVAPPTICGIDYYNLFAPLVGLDLPGNKSTGNFFDTLLETDSYSAYGQVYYHLGDRITLTGGVRFTFDDKAHTQTTIDFATLEPTTLADQDDWDSVTPKLGIEYRPNDSTMVYGSVTTGFKSGGFNSISLQPSFDQEDITSYEVGVKSRLADDKVTLNAAAFHYDYDDLQVAVLFPDRSAVENAAKAEVDGLEIDLVARPNRRLTFELGLAVIDDEFQDFLSRDPVEVARVQDELNAAGIFDPVALALARAAVPPTDLAGRGLQRAPDFSANASLQYVFSLGGAGSLVARGQYQYTDDLAFDPFERFVQDGYSLLHASLTWSPPGGRWLVRVYGRNLGDEEYRVSELFARVTGSLQVWAPPAQYGLQVGFDF